MSDLVLVTGATGVLGRALVNAALDGGLAVRQAIRGDVSHRANPRAEAVRFDYTDPATIAPALAGVTKLVLIAPPLEASAAAQLAPVIAEAKRAGVRHAVLISALGVNHNEQAPLRIVERQLMESGIAYTILRPNFFMDNFSAGFLSESIRRQRSIFLAAGDGKTSFISVADIAAAAVAALQQPDRLAGREFDLTGSESLDHHEVAREITRALADGTEVVYHSLTEEQMLVGARAAGTPDSAAAYLAMLYSVVRNGYAAAVTPDFEQITGRAAQSFQDFAKSAAAAGAWSN